jgi:putative transposase
MDEISATHGRVTRIACVVARGLPHPVAQRGNRGERIFLEEGDCNLHRDWPAASCRRFGVACWAYCLMPDHGCLTLTPEDASALALALARVHRLHAGHVNARARQTGHLFQRRFGSAATDEEPLMAAAQDTRKEKAKTAASRKSKTAKPSVSLK